MTQPHKVCPRCQQPAALYVPVCLRCGLPYADAPRQMPAHPAAFQPTLTGNAARELRSANKVGRSGPLLALLLTVGAGGAVAYEICRITASASAPALVGRNVPGKKALPALTASRPTPAFAAPPSLTGQSSAPPAAPSSNFTSAPAQAPPPAPSMTTESQPEPPSNPGAFVERPSTAEIPTINVTQTSFETDTLVFYDVNGREYDLTCSPTITASLQLPPGEYTYRLSCGNPYIRGQSGTATFRRFKAYDLYIHITPDDGDDNHHIGDE